MGGQATLYPDISAVPNDNTDGKQLLAICKGRTKPKKIAVGT